MNFLTKTKDNLFKNAPLLQVMGGFFYKKFVGLWKSNLQVIGIDWENWGGFLKNFLAYCLNKISEAR